MSETTTTLRLADLPGTGQLIAGGKFAGLTTGRDGTHAAVILLDDKPTALMTWHDAKAWAAGLDAELPTRPVAALLFANLKPEFQPDWHWTTEEYSASSAWGCTFLTGYQLNYHECAELCARAVRLIPIAD